jgi:hypothetical protein
LLVREGAAFLYLHMHMCICIGVCVCLYVRASLILLLVCPRVIDSLPLPPHRRAPLFLPPPSCIRANISLRARLHGRGSSVVVGKGW